MNRYLLTQALDGWAEIAPERMALRCESDQLSYGELAQMSDQLATILINQGIQKNDRVGIYMNKSIKSVVSLYGIMKAGAAYVPLDPLAPVDRVRFVMQDCGIKIAISSPTKAENIVEMQSSGLELDAVIGLGDVDEVGVRAIAWEQVFEQPYSRKPEVDVVEQDLAYILYTSGSTGVPKGIMHTHRSGLSFANWATETYGLERDDRLSNHAPLHFDLSTFDIFAGHIAGAATVVIPEGITKFPTSMAKLIEDERITVWYSVPFALIQMLLRADLPSRDLSALRWVLFAGEPFPTKHLRSIMNQIPHARFSNLFGPTETNVCTFYNVSPLDPEVDDPIPIGVPCANVEALIVDHDDASVGLDEAGELLIRGGVVMRGYWGQPQKTRDGFFQKESIRGSVDKYYRTGDLVRRRSDGNLEYLGRKDRQIKTRGYRVELDEIEVAFLAIAGVEQVAVYPLSDGQGSNLIHAAVIPTDGKILQPEELESELAKRLPAYAIPVSIQVRDGFPRTSTGKIDRRALQEMDAVEA